MRVSNYLTLALLSVGFLLTFVVFFLKADATAIVSLKTGTLVTRSSVGPISSDVTFLRLVNAELCGEPVSKSQGNNQACGSREVLAQQFTGALQIPSGTELRFDARATQFLVSIRPSPDASVIPDFRRPLKAKHIVASVPHLNGEFRYLSNIDQFVIGAVPSYRFDTRQTTIFDGKISLIDRGVLGRVIAGGDLEIPSGSILSFCADGESRENRCGEAYIDISNSDNLILANSRVIARELVLSGFGTSGYNVELPLWKRLVGEPLIIYLWGIIGLISALEKTVGSFTKRGANS